MTDLGSDLDQPTVAEAPAPAKPTARVKNAATYHGATPEYMAQIREKAIIRKRDLALVRKAEAEFSEAQLQRRITRAKEFMQQK